MPKAPFGDPYAPVPRRVQPPPTVEHPGQRSNPNALLTEKDQMAPVSPAEPLNKRKLKKPRLTNVGIVTGVNTKNPPV